MGFDLTEEVYREFYEVTVFSLPDRFWAIDIASYSR